MTQNLQCLNENGNILQLTIQSNTHEHSDTMYQHLANKMAVSIQEVTDNANAVFRKTATKMNHAHPFITICLLLWAFIRKHIDHIKTYEEFCKLEVLPNTEMLFSRPNFLRSQFMVRCKHYKNHKYIFMVKVIQEDKIPLRAAQSGVQIPAEARDSSLVPYPEEANKKLCFSVGQHITKCCRKTYVGLNKHAQLMNNP